MTAQNARYIKDINFVLLVGSISVEMNVQNDLRNSETRWPGLWKAITPVNNYKTLAKYLVGGSALATNSNLECILHQLYF